MTNNNYTLMKKYHIKELSEDGLLKTPMMDGYRGLTNKFRTFGYDCKTDAYNAIKSEDMGKDRMGKYYKFSGQYVVIEMVQWRLEREDMMEVEESS